MYADELRKLNTTDLQKLLAEKREELLEIRFKIAARGEKNVRREGAIRKEIARILTVMAEK